MGIVMKKNEWAFLKKLLAVLCWCVCFSYASATTTFNWEVGFMGMYFPEEGAYEQSDSVFSGRLQSELYHSWNNDEDSIVFMPTYIQHKYYDGNSHFDIKELAWLHVEDRWELTTGIKTVFWGVTESRHLVDIINQTDYTYRFDGENKLGQPMLNLSLMRDYGIIDLFMLLGSRQRLYPNIEGRLRGPLTVNNNFAAYENSSEENSVDFAIRWQHAIDNLEFSVSHFSGTSRDPNFIGLNDNQELMSYYPDIHQTGLELQYIFGDWIWKLESILRSGQLDGKSYSAATGGVEYTQVGIFDSNIDLGWIVEYSADDRGGDADHASERDFFVGTRWVLNDDASSQALVFVNVDSHTGEQVWSLEAKRRLERDWFITVDISVFANTGDAPTLEEFLYQSKLTDNEDVKKLALLDKDSYIQIELIKYF